MPKNLFHVQSLNDKAKKLKTFVVVDGENDTPVVAARGKAKRIPGFYIECLFMKNIFRSRRSKLE